jgi:hypothetical protein
MTVANSDATKRDDRRSRYKSVGKQDRRDTQRAQDRQRKNKKAVLDNIKKSDLFYVAGLQTKVLALGVSGLEPLPCQSASRT